jgi:hypothetical protein
LDDLDQEQHDDIVDAGAEKMDMIRQAELVARLTGDSVADALKKIQQRASKQ